MTKSIVLHNRDGHGFRPPCFRQIRSYRGPLFHEECGLPHPVAIFNFSWAKVLREFERTLDAYDEARNQTDTPTAQGLEPLISSFKSLLYVSTEFIEDIEDNIAKTFMKGKKAKLSGPESCRKQIAIPCNKLKHEHNRIHAQIALAPLFKVIGFGIYYVKGNTLQINPIIHRDKNGSSFNVALRRIMSSIYLFAYDIGLRIAALGHESSNAEPPENDQKSIEILKRLEELPIFAMPHENKNRMPILRFDADALFISDRGGEILPAPPRGRMVAMFEGDGMTRSFQLPYR